MKKREKELEELTMQEVSIIMSIVAKTSKKSVIALAITLVRHIGERM